jgi:zona occludens toxin (predicted ATPase)
MVRIPKTALYTVLSVVILLVLLVGGGIAYVWYTGQNTPDIATIDAASASDESDAPLTPTKPAANAQASASVQVLNSPVAPGENTSISIKTVPTSTCTIKVMYGDVPSTDSGLTTKTADEFGIVSWTWTVGATVPTGTWPVTVTCNYNGRSAVVQGNLVVVR